MGVAKYTIGRYQRFDPNRVKHKSGKGGGHSKVLPPPRGYSNKVTGYAHGWPSFLDGTATRGVVASTKERYP